MTLPSANKCYEFLLKNANANQPPTMAKTPSSSILRQSNFLTTISDSTENIKVPVECLYIIQS